MIMKQFSPEIECNRSRKGCRWRRGECDVEERNPNRGRKVFYIARTEAEEREEGSPQFL
jgi:hypothetical protein